MLTWILNFFQDFSLVLFVISIIILIGSNLIPIIYRLPTQLISVFLIIVCVFLYGGKQERVKWEVKLAESEAKIVKIEQQRKLDVAEANIKIAKLDNERKDVTIKVNTQIAKNRELIKENSRLRNAEKYITKEENAACVIPNSFIRLHNDAARNSSTTKPISEPTGTSNGATTTSEDTPRESDTPGSG